VLLFSLVTPVYSLYFCIVLFTRFNKLNDDDDDDDDDNIVYYSKTDPGLVVYYLTIPQSD